MPDSAIVVFQTKESVLQLILNEILSRREFVVKKRIMRDQINKIIQEWLIHAYIITKMNVWQTWKYDCRSVRLENDWSRKISLLLDIFMKNQIIQDFVAFIRWLRRKSCHQKETIKILLQSHLLIDTRHDYWTKEKRLRKLRRLSIKKDERWKKFRDNLIES